MTEQETTCANVLKPINAGDVRPGQVQERVRCETRLYQFWSAGRRISELAKTHLKTPAEKAEAMRLRELQEGFNGTEGTRAERISPIRELADAYLEDYKLRNKSATFAEYAMGHVKRLAGGLMLMDATNRTVSDYETRGISFAGRCGATRC